MLLYDLTWRGRAAGGSARRPTPPWRCRLPLFLLRGALHMHLPRSYADNPLFGAGFLDGAAHGRQGNRQVSVAVPLAGPLVGGLFLQRGAAVWLASGGMGGREGAHRAGGLPRRRAAGCPLVSHAEAAVLLPRFLFRRSGPDVEPGDSHREHHGRAVRLSAFDRPRRVRGCGNLRIGRQVSRERLLAMRTAWIALGLVCLACAARTYARNFDWLDERSLWTSAVDACPGSAKAHTNLGNALSERPAGCRTPSPSIKPPCGSIPIYAEAHHNLGNALSQLPGGCRTPLPSLRRRCGSIPTRRGAQQPGNRPGADARPAAGRHRPV